MVVNSSLHSRFNYDERFGQLQAKLRDYENRMKMMQPVNLSITDFSKTASASLGTQSMNIPSWFLFKYEDIPARFRITDMNDPRLVNSTFLNEFAGWMNGKITELGLTSVCKPTDHASLQRVIQLLRDPVNFEKGKDFIMGHELAHLAHYQEATSAQIDEAMCIGGVTVGIFLLAFAIATSSIVHLTITVGVAGVSVILTGGCALAWIAQTKPAVLSEIEEEKKADLDSANMLKDVDGGIYYFQSSIDRHLRLRRSLPEMRRDIDERGNYLKDKAHPPLTDRVAYLREWKRVHLDFP